MQLAISEVSSSRARRHFFALPRRIYRGDARYLAPLRAAEHASLDRQDFNGRQRVLLAFEDGEPIARVVARVSPQLRDDGGNPLGLLGFFDAFERPETVRALLGEAVAWLRRQGAGEIAGPMDGDTWHRYRFSLGPGDDRPFLMEPYNPPYYPKLWERSGFVPLEDYYSKQVEDLAAVAARMRPRLEGALAAGFRFEALRLDRFDSELDRFYRLSTAIFRGNFLYSEISAARFADLYRGSRRLLDPDFVTFAVAPDGADAGFLFGFPDRFDAVAALGGRKGPWAALRFLAARRRPVDTVNLKSLGVVAEHRRSHLASALMAHGYRTALRKGYRRANLCLIQGENPSGRLDAGLGRLLRRYRLYRLGGEAA